MEVKTDTMIKAAALDHPMISRFLFHPRKASRMQATTGVKEVLVDLKDGAAIGCRLHLGKKENPNILFFHGNGEIAHDYDPIGTVYLSHGINFIIADYRGYGISTGEPSVSAMLSDAYTVFDQISEILAEPGHTGPIWVMGRSLGSAPAIEVAANRTGQLSGLIVESGFAGVEDLLARLGILSGVPGIDRRMYFSNADNIKTFHSPVLIIHAEHDDIIPLDHGKELYESAPAQRKDLWIVNGADHNNIFDIAGSTYFKHIKNFVYYNK
jgi:fermentation-respiration switch protein FrsA (DUF1100 family)